MEKNLLITKLQSIKGVTVIGNYIEFNDKADLDAQVLPNFKLREFLTKNKANTYTITNIDLLLMLNSIRKFWGSGIGISSTYRSPSYNRSINGATSSQHILGNALDIYPTNGKIKEFQNEVNKLNIFGGVGFYNTFMHIDSGNKRFWDERK